MPPKSRFRLAHRPLGARRAEQASRVARVLRRRMAVLDSAGRPSPAALQPAGAQVRAFRDTSLADGGGRSSNAVVPGLARSHRSLPWPELLSLGGLPNLQVVNSVIHSRKSAKETRTKSVRVRGQGATCSSAGSVGDAIHASAPLIFSEVTLSPPFFLQPPGRQAENDGTEPEAKARRSAPSRLSHHPCRQWNRQAPRFR